MSAGDCCHLEITLPKDQISKFIELVKAQPDETRTAHGRVTLIYLQADCGFITEREHATEAGLMFYGHHESADGVSAMRFAAFNKEQRDHPIIHGFRELMVEVDDDGIVSQEGINQARRLLELERKCREKMSNGSDKVYSFSFSILGAGETVEEAWEHAVEQLAVDPGDHPETYSLEEE